MTTPKPSPWNHTYRWDDIDTQRALLQRQFAEAPWLGDPKPAIEMMVKRIVREARVK